MYQKMGFAFLIFGDQLLYYFFFRPPSQNIQVSCNKFISFGITEYGNQLLVLSRLAM